MKFLFSVMIWILFVGGLWAYTSQRDADLPKTPVRVDAPEVLTGNYVLEITPGFSSEHNPFALTLDDNSSQSPHLGVRLNGRELIVGMSPFQRGKVIQITSDLIFSRTINEIYVTASPSMAETDLAHSLRVRLLNNGAPVVDQTFWSSGGAVVAGSVTFRLAEHRKADHEQ